MSDEDEEIEFISFEDINEIIEKLDKKDSSLVRVLMAQNADLIEAVFDLQEFMQDEGYNSKNFKEWKNKREMRTIH